MLKGIQARDWENQELVLTTPDNHPHAPILFYRHGAVSVWESTGRSRSATTGGLSGVRAFQSQPESGMEYGLAGGKEPRPDRGSPPTR